MKKVFSLLLAVLMLVSALPVAYAAGTNDYTAGTAVVYTAANNEDYSITVPAFLAPGSSGTVTLAGTWAPNTTISVTADTSVKLTNSINAADTKTLSVKFNGISEAGSNTSSQTFTAPVSVDPIENAIFGTWGGHFYYTVGTETEEPTVTPILEGDGQVFFTALPETLTFRSTAPMSEFQEVQVNGVTVDPSNYTVTEGSTIITLHEDYLMTLSAEGHQITVVSDSGSPSAGFSVRDEITYEPEGDYIYTIMQDGFETLEDARTYYRHYAEAKTGLTWDEIVANFGDEENAWNNIGFSLGEEDTGVINGIGLLESNFVASASFSTYWSVTAKNKTKSSYEEMNNELLSYPVKDIEYAFSECNNLTIAPTIPNSVTRIGEHAFSGCEKLASVTIPNSVTSIGNMAFYGCEGLTSITIPDSITHIGIDSFNGCINLATVSLGKNVSIIDEYAFCGCESLNNITLPDNLATIGKNAFTGCISLTDITIPGTVTEIGAGAFAYSSLTNIIFSEGIDSIGDYTLLECTNLTSVTIPESVTEISTEAFFYSPNLDEVIYLGTVEQWNSIESIQGNLGVMFSDTLVTEIICSDGTVKI